MKNYEHIIQRYIPRVKEKYPEKGDSTFNYVWYSKELDDWHAEYDRVNAKIKKYTDPMFNLWCDSDYSDVPFSLIYKWYKRRDKVENVMWREIYLTYSNEIDRYHLTTDTIVLIMEKWNNGVFPAFSEPYLLNKKKDEDWNRKYYRCTALIWYLKSKLKQLEQIVDRNENDLSKLIKLAQIAGNKKNIDKDFKEDKEEKVEG
jgi:hypothetical protein